MKRKEAIKQIQEGKAQVFNDYHPSTKEIKKFLKEAFPEDKHETNEAYIKYKFFKKDSSPDLLWYSSNNEFNLPIINLSTITKRKKTKLSQLEQQFSELSKDVSELRQTLAKDSEVVSEDVEREIYTTGKKWFIDESYPKWFMCFDYDNNKYYGIDTQGNWHCKEDDIRQPFSHEKLATPQEVETALVNEAKKKYKKGDRVLGLYSDSVVTLSLETTILSDSPYHLDQSNQLWMRTSGGLNEIVFQDGIWSEIKETIKEDEIDWDVPQLVISVGSDDVLIIATTRDEDADLFVGVVVKGNSFHEAEIISHWDKESFRPFKGKLIIEQSL